MEHPHPGGGKTPVAGGGVMEWVRDEGMEGWADFLENGTVLSCRIVHKPVFCSFPCNSPGITVLVRSSCSRDRDFNHVH